MTMNWSLIISQMLAFINDEDLFLWWNISYYKVLPIFRAGYQSKMFDTRNNTNTFTLISVFIPIS